MKQVENPSVVLFEQVVLPGCGLDVHEKTVVATIDGEGTQNFCQIPPVIQCPVTNQMLVEDDFVFNCVTVRSVMTDNYLILLASITVNQIIWEIIRFQVMDLIKNRLRNNLSFS